MEYLPVFDITGLLEIKHKDIYVGRFAPYLKLQHKLSVPHGHSFYHIVFFTKGAGWHTIDFYQFEVKPFQIYFMIPGQIHNWNFEGIVDGYVINFSDIFFQSFLLKADYIEDFDFFQGITNNSVIDIPKSLQSKIVKHFEDMLAVKIGSGDYGIDKLRVLILLLFHEISELNSKKTETNDSSNNLKLLRSFQGLIEKHYKKIKLPNEYAKMIFVT
ncbi:MAG: AraC family ligand binding domain-containing protein, partial [Pyrinomonadaceae bacterium]|nr:AraC family ligand binding domain-containing protein [Sphingobacteriaceae bacterium]